MCLCLFFFHYFSSYRLFFLCSGGSISTIINHSIGPRKPVRWLDNAANLSPSSSDRGVHALNCSIPSPPSMLNAELYLGLVQHCGGLKDTGQYVIGSAPVLPCPMDRRRKAITAKHKVLHAHPHSLGSRNPISMITCSRTYYYKQQCVLLFLYS